MQFVFMTNVIGRITAKFDLAVGKSENSLTELSTLHSYIRNKNNLIVVVLVRLKPTLKSVTKL